MKGMGCGVLRRCRRWTPGLGALGLAALIASWGALVAFAEVQAADDDAQQAQSEPAAATSDKEGHEKTLPRNYCGVFCLYGAAKVLGQEIAFDHLVDERYISTGEGSSVADLLNAADDHGLHAVALERMSLGMLESAEWPVILHVKASPDTPRYRHYVLLLAAERGRYLVYDPPTPPTWMSAGELNVVWNGTGIVVADEPVTELELAGAWGLGWIVAAVAIVLLGWPLRLAAQRMLPADVLTGRRRVCLELSAIALAASLIAVGWHVRASNGLVRSAEATAIIRQLHFAPVAVVEGGAMNGALPDVSEGDGEDGRNP